MMFNGTDCECPCNPCQTTTTSGPTTTTAPPQSTTTTFEVECCGWADEGAYIEAKKCVLGGGDNDFTTDPDEYYCLDAGVTGISVGDFACVNGCGGGSFAIKVTNINQSLPSNRTANGSIFAYKTGGHCNDCGT
tara:strand:- start:12305 stop:12706 length:402 start_codon:yes stop_codon:yes gene_type:complete